MRSRGALVGLVLLAAVGCSSSAEEAPTPEYPNQVTVVNRAYSPQTITVRVGDTVTWVFDDKGMSHDVVADDRSFRSPLMVSDTFTHTFTEPGTFTYHCTPHPDMTGTVVVES
ncbi:copper-binding protein [Rhodococcus sp. Eu-32]|uniref:plastocyanin/azurin family copper-binding protein n=1 Tax=Rhodococcus sp. Eu-32 TaxID=1017319 RepID=UPI000DF2A133|nr:plastocyanin/azurin family copper-binding protein [Rhodococcus sp. Eu-32]RRQ25932.1 copper-binding protein [Rhodococcus sp. Eu-32]